MLCAGGTRARHSVCTNTGPRLNRTHTLLSRNTHTPLQFDHAVRGGPVHEPRFVDARLLCPSPLSRPSVHDLNECRATTKQSNQSVWQSSKPLPTHALIVSGTGTGGVIVLLAGAPSPSKLGAMLGLAAGCAQCRGCLWEYPPTFLGHRSRQTAFRSAHNFPPGLLQTINSTVAPPRMPASPRISACSGFV